METASVHFLRLAGKILATAAGMALVVLLIGYFLHWENPVQYSNAFFWAGTIAVLIGVFSVTGGVEQRGNFGMTYAETASIANLAERNQRMAADITQRYGTMIFLVITGLLLIGAAVAIGQFLVD